MVEKIIINPTKVRGYGNIVSSKGANDFITYAGSITEGTDTVYGATEKVFSLEDTIIFRDGGVTGNKNTDWYIRDADTSELTVTVDDGGTLLSSTATTASRFYFANPEHSTSTSPPITMSDFVIECDVISTTFGSGSQIAFLLQGLGNTFNLSGYTAPYHPKMEKTGTTVKQYINDTLIRTTTISDRTNYYAGFQLYKTGSIKFKNYVIYSI